MPFLIRSPPACVTRAVGLVNERWLYRVITPFIEGARYASIPDAGLSAALRDPNFLATTLRRVAQAVRVLHGCGYAPAWLCEADLIVMGSHGRSGLPRWFVGSVADLICKILSTIADLGA